MTRELIAGLEKMRKAALEGAKQGLKGAAGSLKTEMRTSPVHGDVTGASHANYTAYVVGGGETGSSEIAESISAVESLNPGHSDTSTVSIQGELGVVITSFTDYQIYLETENAGARAVIGPATAASGSRFTQAAASGMKRALS